MSWRRVAGPGGAPGAAGADLSPDELRRWRAEFPILASSVYMISNSLGAMPREAAEALAEYARTWATRGVRAWEESWWEMAAVVGDEVGELIGAPPGTVSTHENVTTAAMVALSSLDPRPERHRIVTTRMEFPSLLYLFEEQKRVGFELEVVPAEPDLTVRTERLLDAIDGSTLVVAVSHVLFRNSCILDVAAVVERARRVGARVLLDTYQSAGIIPLDVSALGVDYAVGGCLKWLCGGPGCAFLYVRPELRGERPRFTGWLAHRDPFAFDPGGLRRREDGPAFMNGTPSIPALYAARPGLRIIKEVGVGRIRERSRRMTERLLRRADELGLACAAPRDPDRLAGTVAVAAPEGRHVARTLKSRDLLVDWRAGAGIRISPHFYNTWEEVDRVMAELGRVVETKEYDPDEPFDSPVT